MPIILLIRHGENDFLKQGRLPGRLEGVHLNDKGRQQAEELVKTLAAAPIKAIYSSPLDRTVETAAPLAAARGLDVIPRDGLLELDCGDWAGLTLKSLRRRSLWKTVQNRPSMMRFPNGESFGECQQRLARELEAICTLHRPGDVVACFSHSDPIKLAIAYFTGIPLDLFQRLIVAPASISTLMMGDGQAQLINLNALAGFDFPQPPKKKPVKKAGS